MLSFSFDLVNNNKYKECSVLQFLQSELYPNIVKYHEILFIKSVYCKIGTAQKLGQLVQLVDTRMCRMNFDTVGDDITFYKVIYKVYKIIFLSKKILI